jgi:hypothetical protein
MSFVTCPRCDTPNSSKPRGRECIKNSRTFYASCGIIPLRTAVAGAKLFPVV